jgi:solute carrier family 39 (zinc transporter), member 1/2/3
MEDLPLRFASTVLIFAMGLVGGLIPWWVGRRASHGEHGAHGIDWLSLGNCFAGGVIIAAGFVHLLGDAASGYAAAYPKDDFPWPFAIAAASFVSILAIERVLPRIPAGDRSGGDPEAAALVAAAAGGVFPYLLLLTLSIHSLIAGLALGTQTSSSGFAIVLVAILAHKGSAAFALGVSMHRAEIPRRRATPLIAGFAVMTPIGVLAGILLTSLASSDAEAAFEIWFDAIAAGTFIYIGALDIIREEFIPARSGRRRRFIATGVGLLVMTLVAIWT